MSKLSFKIKHLIAPPVIYSIVFFTLYFRLQGVSGGDILVGATSGIFLIAMTLILGLITFSWKMKEKFGYLIGILASFLLGVVYHGLLL